MNEVLHTIIIAPITSTPKKYPTRLKINTPEASGMIAFDQIRTIDKSRIVTVHKSISTEMIVKSKGILSEMLIE